MSDRSPLLEAYLNGELDDQGFVAFNAWLREDPAHLRQWVTAAFMAQELGDALAEQRKAVVKPTVTDKASAATQGGMDAEVLELLKQIEASSHDAPLVDITESLKAKRKQKKQKNPNEPTAQDYINAGRYVLRMTLTSKPAKKFYTWSAIAAVLLLAFVLFNPFASDTPDTVADLDFWDDPETTTPPAVAPGITPVATLTAEHDAQWAERASAHGSLTPGSKLHPGTRLTLTAGFAEITTARGAVAILQAPATIELLDNNNALRLHAGKLVGICETELSKGFAVKTDHADIVDLGTEFGVNVASGQLTTTVFAGEVVLKTPGRATQPLVANQTATLIDDGDGLDLAIADQVAQGFTLRLPRVATAEQIQSNATPIAAWDFFGSDTSMGIHSGDASTASGLQMTGFTGQWGTLPPGQGEIREPDGSVLTGETTGQSNGITLRWAVDGVGATGWAWQSDRANGLFSDYYYINRKPGRWGGSAIPWRIEGLTPGARYDLIFYGTGSRFQNGADVAIQGHDAGNGVGSAATLDLENDANFLSVVADEQGMISGTFGNPGDKEAQVSGVQIGKLTVPGPSR